MTSRPDWQRANILYPSMKKALLAKANFHATICLPFGKNTLNEQNHIGDKPMFICVCC